MVWLTTEKERERELNSVMRLTAIHFMHLLERAQYCYSSIKLSFRYSLSHSLTILSLSNDSVFVTIYGHVWRTVVKIRLVVWVLPPFLKTLVNVVFFYANFTFACECVRLWIIKSAQPNTIKAGILFNRMYYKKRKNRIKKEIKN